MRVGLYWDFPAPGGARFWEEIREQARAADELGFDSLWYAERHFADDAPGALPILAAHLATATRAVRIGGFQVLPLANPVRVAEDWAVVDLVSGGRANLGVARGEDRAPFRISGRDWTKRERILWEGLDFVRHAWTSDEIQFAGRHVRFPAHVRPKGRGPAARARRHEGAYVPQWERGPDVPDHLAVTPKPLQQPHPPVWVLGVEGALVRSAATRGLSCALPVEWPSKRVAAEASAFRRALARSGRHPAEVELGVVRDVTFERSAAGRQRGAAISGSSREVVDALKRVQDETGMNHLLWRIPYPTKPHASVLADFARFAAEVQPMLQS